MEFINKIKYGCKLKDLKKLWMDNILLQKKEMWISVNQLVCLEMGNLQMKNTKKWKVLTNKGQEQKVQMGQNQDLKVN